MTERLHPAAVLYAGIKPLPALPACEHYAGNEKLIRKALQLQSGLGPIFDITADCEDGAPAGGEKQHAEMRIGPDPRSGISAWLRRTPPGSDQT